jgi:general stress protein YciG
MTWFKVDDSLHSHPKAAAVSLAALGLWTVAGSWAGAHLTDGFIPEHMVPLLSRGASELADELVAAGLWKRGKGGYRFHEWLERNPSAEEVKEQRVKRADAGRKGGLASGKSRSKRQANASADASPIVEPPSRPVPFLPNGRKDGDRADASQRGIPGNPDWRELPAYGQLDPQQAAINARHAAEARAAIKRRAS